MVFYETLGQFHDLGVVHVTNKIYNSLAMAKLYHLYLVSDKQAFNSNFIIRDVLRTFSKDYMELYGLQGILKALRTKPTIENIV